MNANHELGPCAFDRETRPTCDVCEFRQTLIELMKVTDGLEKKVDDLTAVLTAILDYAEGTEKMVETIMKLSHGTVR